MTEPPSRLADRRGAVCLNDPLKGQPGLERQGGRTTPRVCTRITQRLLAMAAAIWHHWQTGAAGKRSLIAYDH